MLDTPTRPAAQTHPVEAAGHALLILARVHHRAIQARHVPSIHREGQGLQQQRQWQPQPQQQEGITEE